VKAGLRTGYGVGSPSYRRARSTDKSRGLPHQFSLEVPGTKRKKGRPEFIPGVPRVCCVGAKTGYCPAPVFSAGFSAGFFGAAASELPPLSFQKSSALIHSAGT